MFDNENVMADLSESLNANNLSQGASAGSRPDSVKSELFSIPINGTNTTFVLIKYSNRIFITVTESKKIGNLYSIRLDSPQRNGLYTRGPAVFDIKCVLGADSEEKTVAVRSLAEKLDLPQPLLLSLTISTFDYSTITQIAEAILAKKCW